MKGLRRRTRARLIVRRGRRRRTSRRRRPSRPWGRGRRAGQVPKGPPGHDRTGVRSGGTVLLGQVTAELLGFTQVVQLLDVPLPHGAGHNRSPLVAKPHQGAAQRHKECMVHPIIEDGRGLPWGAPQARPYGRVNGTRGPQLGRPLPRKKSKGRPRGTRGSPKKRSRPTATPKEEGPTGPRMPAWPSGHLCRARYRAPHGRPQDGGGGSRSGRGGRGLWRHHEANTGRPSLRQVPIQESVAVEGCHVLPIGETGVPLNLREDQGPLVVQSLGTTEDPSGSPRSLNPRG